MTRAIACDRGVVIYAFAVVASVLTGVLVESVASIPPWKVAFAVGLIGLSAGGALVIRRCVARRQAFSIVSLLTGFFLLEFVAGGLWYRVPRPDGVLGGLLRVYSERSMALAVLLGFAAWTALVAGYWSATRIAGAARRMPQPPIDARLPLVIVSLFAIGWIARLLVLRDGFYFHFSPVASDINPSASRNLITSASMLPLIGTALVGLRRRSGGWSWVSYGALLVTEAAWAIPSGERSRVVALILLALIVSYVRSGHRFPARAAAIGALFCVLVVFPFGAWYRGAGGQSGYQQSPAEQLSRTLDLLVGQSPLHAVDDGVAEARQRFSGVTSVAVLIWQGRDRYPSTPETAAEAWVAGLVPRVVLPSKADPSGVGNEFGRAYGILPSRSVNTSTVAVTQPGDFYGTFGVIGCLLGCAVVGGAVRLLDEYFISGMDNALVAAVYVAFVGTFVLGFETTFAVGFLQALKELALFFALIGAVLLIAPGLRVRRTAAPAELTSRAS